MSRAAIAILSTENLLHNLQVIKLHAPQTSIIAMIKANAYGHGIRSVALRLEKHIYSFGVASIDEAEALRKSGIKIPITLMEGVFDIEELLVASCQRFNVVFHDIQQVQWIESIDIPIKIDSWIKIDTGMGRLGFSIDEANYIWHRLSKNNNINHPIGIMSHFACADEIDHPSNKKQIACFKEFVKDKSGLKSFCNSPAIFNFKDTCYDVIRPGLALYGVSSIENRTASDLNLRPVMTLKTKLIALKNYTSGSTIGYGSRYICKKNMMVGIIAMGYGDGYPRITSETVPVLINNIKCRIIGQVSMDMIAVDLTNCPNAKIGNMATLWGENLSIEKVAKAAKRSVYELLCAIQYRVKFHWTSL